MTSFGTKGEVDYSNDPIMLAALLARGEKIKSSEDNQVVAESLSPVFQISGDNNKDKEIIAKLKASFPNFEDVEDEVRIISDAQNEAIATNNLEKWQDMTTFKYQTCYRLIASALSRKKSDPAILSGG